MNFDELDALTSKESKEKAEKAQANAKADKASIVQAYARLFSTKDGERVLQDLSTKFIYENNTPFNSPNINYESAFHNGESGIVKFIINQMQRARVI